MRSEHTDRCSLASGASRTRESRLCLAGDARSRPRKPSRQFARLTRPLRAVRQCFVRRGFSSRPIGQKSSQEKVQNGQENTLVDFRFLAKLEVEAAVQLQRLQAIGVHSELRTGSLIALQTAGPAPGDRATSSWADEQASDVSRGRGSEHVKYRGLRGLPRSVNRLCRQLGTRRPSSDRD